LVIEHDNDDFEPESISFESDGFGAFRNGKKFLWSLSDDRLLIVGLDLNTTWVLARLDKHVFLILVFIVVSDDQRDPIEVLGVMTMTRVPETDE